ncbi:PREDICTED: beta-1 adrenergic receptor-like [Acropora digitifera]|uniref:beta-1 adrenergic receptor-like n=1 Tax=Acropora digitifera TaxID=70779 RepID=UPI00077A3D23|nr:PREDICTED: beta-1 adrenergic receptor-like [Acropora digitifera]
MGTNLWNISWTLSFGVISVASIAGNAITIFIFLKKRPLTWPKCLLISLAVADFLVGLITVPFYVSSFWIFEEFSENVVLRASLDCIDMFTGFASIFTLAVIALERLYAIGWPLRHRVLRNEIYFAAIATPWSRLRTRHHIQEERNLKLAKTVAIVTGAFLITWLPFELFLLSMNLCISCRVILVGMVLKLLQYGNSVVNIIIYCFGNAEYRAAFLAIFRSCRRSCRKHRKVLQSSVLRITVRNGNSTDNL